MGKGERGALDRTGAWMDGEQSGGWQEQVWPVTVPPAGLLPQALVPLVSPRFQEGASLDKDSPF